LFITQQFDVNMRSIGMIQTQTNVPQAFAIGGADEWPGSLFDRTGNNKPCICSGI
jgi:hypothetical protein